MCVPNKLIEFRYGYKANNSHTQYIRTYMNFNIFYTNFYDSCLLIFVLLNSNIINN